jgi:hypothetical protein
VHCLPGPGRRATAASDRDIIRSMILEQSAHPAAAHSFILFLHCRLWVNCGQSASLVLSPHSDSSGITGLVPEDDHLVAEVGLQSLEMNNPAQGRAMHIRVVAGARFNNNLRQTVCLLTIPRGESGTASRRLRRKTREKYHV